MIMQTNVKTSLTRRVMSIGDTVGWKQNGDSKHYGKRTGRVLESLGVVYVYIDGAPLVYYGDKMVF